MEAHSDEVHNEVQVMHDGSLEKVDSPSFTTTHLIT